ncbi:hypothetical protein VO56_01260 [Mycoplasmopsis gallinacea]|uniref:HTH arsR-type domain-containing protein n=1 Tax=Mycoplasmopsis gallinacea TaxID=29556 RepID=A0A0D5ZJP1_9BACT|nr:hypothetical protein VO56_01260 [Mycoplasmopsis gallinacea]
MHSHSHMDMTDLFALLASPVKFKLIIHFYSCVENECDVQTLVQLFNEKQANISKHLSELKRKGVVDSKKEGLYNYYYLNKEFLDSFNEILKSIYNHPEVAKYSCSCFQK